MGSTSVDINMWNPIYAIAPFILLTLSIPLAISAIITTSIAVSLLSLRALVVYCQLASALVGAWLSPPIPKPSFGIYRTLPQRSCDQNSPTRQLNRQASNASNGSQDTITTAANSEHVLRKSDSLSALVGTGDMTQDFEGVGGWRVTGTDEEEHLWIGTNRILQQPAETPNRRHQRSLTAGASPSQRWNFSPEALRMSPVQSRARTPLRFTVDDNDGYFPPQPPSTVKQHVRRKSGSGSSTSSMMMAVKEAGE